MLELQYNSQTGEWDSHETEPKKPESEVPVAQMEQARILGGIENIQVFGIPVGTALLGGTTAFLVSEILDGVIDQGSTTAGLVKLAASGAIIPVFGGMFGREATRSAAMFLAYDAFRNLLPIDDWIGDLVGNLTPGAASQRYSGRQSSPQVPNVDTQPWGPSNGDALDHALETIS